MFYSNNIKIVNKNYHLHDIYFTWNVFTIIAIGDDIIFEVEGCHNIEDLYVTHLDLMSSKYLIFKTL